MNKDDEIKDQMARIRMRSEWVDPQEPIPVENLVSAKDIFDAFVKELTPAHCETLRRMPYNEFIYTDYWRIVRNRVLWHNKVCSHCGGGRWFNVHHKTYEHHGYEHEHLEDLIVLCGYCHNHSHGVDTPACHVGRSERVDSILQRLFKNGKSLREAL